MTKKASTFVFVLGSVLLIVLVLAWLLVIRPTSLALKQVGVFTDLETYSQALQGYHERFGRYPLELEEAASAIDWFSPVDRWGTPLVYLSDGDVFVLASMGKGGQPDGENYLGAREEIPVTKVNEGCLDPSVDQIVTDRGWYRGCGK